MEKNHRVVLTIIALAQFMVVLDVTVVNVALPHIQSDLHFSSSGLQWVVSAYTLLFGGFLLLGGRTADLLGRRDGHTDAPIRHRLDAPGVPPATTGLVGGPAISTTDEAR